MVQVVSCAAVVVDTLGKVKRATRSTELATSRHDTSKPASLKKAVADLEKRMISEALQSTRNNQQQAAKTLGLSRQGLINKMKRYAIAG